MATLSAPCPHCRHDKSIFESVWAEKTREPYSTMWHAYFDCIHCHKGIGTILVYVQKAGRNEVNPMSIKGNVEDSFAVGLSWPNRNELSAPDHTPQPVGKRFIEGEDAFARKNWNSAVAMYRSALDIATKGMSGVPKLSFFERLKWIFDNGRITQDIKEWADHVRVEGNNSLHETDEFSEEDAAALRFFTEMFLRYVFELPGKVTAFRAKPAKS